MNEQFMFYVEPAPTEPEPSAGYGVWLDATVLDS